MPPSRTGRPTTDTSVKWSCGMSVLGLGSEGHMPTVAVDRKPNEVMCIRELSPLLTQSTGRRNNSKQWTSIDRSLKAERRQVYCDA